MNKKAENRIIRDIKVETHDAKWLYDNLQNASISSDNSFQRRYVWLEKHRIKLIESILIGYPIPEIYLWLKQIRSENGEAAYSIIDGQQRLGALQDFINNNFHLRAEDLEFSDSAYANKTFEGLDKENKVNLWKYPFSLRIVDSNIKREEIVNMFLRLNSVNMNLNPQELRNAKFEGKFIQLAEEIANHEFWETYHIFKAGEVRRMQDLEFVSLILVFFRKGIEDELTQGNLDEVYELYNEIYEESEGDKQLFLSLIQECQKIFLYEPNNKSLVSKTHLYTLFVTLYYFVVKNKELSTNQLQKYTDFVTDYQRKENSLPFTKEYRQLMDAHTRTKKNRLRRFELLKQHLES
jgi:hypothetical protein